MKTSEVLKNTLSLLDNGKAWTKGAFARDANGNSVYEYAESATYWCFAGALYRSAEGSFHERMHAKTLIEKELEKEHYPNMIAFNDEAKTFAEVKEVLEATIATALKEEEEA